MFKRAMLAFAAGAVMLAGTAHAADTFTLKLAHFLPPNAPAQTDVLRPWCDKIEAQSTGRLKCQIFPAMQLGGTPSQLVDQVRNGVADIVWTVPGYSAGRFPIIEAMEQPFMVVDATSGSRAVWDYYNTYAQKEFAPYKVLAVHVDGGAVLHTSKVEVKNLADMKGLKLRVPTRLAAKTLESLGGIPVSMPAAQITEAISKSVVDGAMTTWELLRAAKIDEVTKFHISPPQGQPRFVAAVLAMLMNKQKYDALPPDLKAIIDANSGAPLVERFGRVWDEVTAANMAHAAAIGNHLSNLDPAAYDAMRVAAEPVATAWVAERNAKGLDGAKLLKGAREIAAKYAAGNATGN